MENSSHIGSFFNEEVETKLLSPTPVNSINLSTCSLAEKSLDKPAPFRVTENLPDGWIKVSTQRVKGASQGRWDHILISPSGHRFRTPSQLDKFLMENDLQVDKKFINLNTPAIVALPKRAKRKQINENKKPDGEKIPLLEAAKFFGCSTQQILFDYTFTASPFNKAKKFPLSVKAECVTAPNDDAKKRKKYPRKKQEKKEITTPEQHILQGDSYNSCVKRLFPEQPETETSQKKAKPKQKRKPPKQPSAVHSHPSTGCLNASFNFSESSDEHDWASDYIFGHPAFQLVDPNTLSVTDQSMESATGFKATRVAKRGKPKKTSSKKKFVSTGSDARGLQVFVADYEEELPETTLLRSCMNSGVSVTVATLAEYNWSFEEQVELGGICDKNNFCGGDYFN